MQNNLDKLFKKKYLYELSSESFHYIVPEKNYYATRLDN